MSANSNSWAKKLPLKDFILSDVCFLSRDITNRMALEPKVRKNGLSCVIKLDRVAVMAPEEHKVALQRILNEGE